MTEGFQTYKNYPISGSAIPCTATGHGGWDAHGMIFELEIFKAKSVCRELKRFQSGGNILFESKEEAEEFGLLMCQAWIDGLDVLARADADKVVK